MPVEPTTRKVLVAILDEAWIRSYFCSWSWNWSEACEIIKGMFWKSMQFSAFDFCDVWFHHENGRGISLDIYLLSTTRQ